MKIKNHRDFWAGAMFVVFGLMFIVLSQQYPLGSAAKMGPGYFPTVLGGLMTLLGVIIGIGGVSKKAAALRVDRFDWKIMALLLVAVALFAVMLPRLGMVVSVITLVLLSSVASHEFRLRDTLISIVVLLFIAYGVFVWGLELQFPVLPPFLTNR